MADWSLPVLSSTYANVLTYLDGRLNDAGEMFNSAPTNQPDHTIRFNRSANVGKFQEYLSAAWNDQAISVAGGGTGATTASGARTALGLGTLAVQDSNAVTITAGTIDVGTLSGTIAQSNLGSGSSGAGTKFLADDQTYKTIVGFTSGMLIIYAGSSAPTGWLLCDGSAISRSTYSDLFAIVGTTYGVGNGTTTFNLPDLRQRFPLGKAASGTGNTLGATGGSIDHTHTGPSHTHTYNTVIAHTHTVTDPGHTHDVTGYSGGSGATPTLIADFITQSTPATQSNAAGSKVTGISIDSTGSSSGTTAASGTGATGSNNPPYQVINYIIKT